MYRRLMGMAGATALTVGGLGAVLATGGTAFATTPSVTSNTYLVGTALSGVSFSTTSSVLGKAANYSFTFVMPSGVGGTTTVTLADLPSKTSASSLPTTALVTNTSTGSAGSVEFAPGGSNDYNSGSLSIADPVAGDTYTIALDDVTNSNSTTTISPTITVNNAAFGTASQVTLTSSTTTTTATAAATSTTPGAGGVTDTFSDFTPGSVSAEGDLYLSLSAYDQTFPTGTSAYTVSVDTNGTTTTDAVSSAPSFTPPAATDTPDDPVYLAIPVTNAIASGATVSVTIADITNGNGTSAPISPTTTYAVLGNTGATTAPTAATTGAVSFLTPSLGTLNLSVSPATQGSTATLTETFTTPVAVSGIAVDTVFSGGTNLEATSWAVFDSTNPLGDSNGTGSTPSLNSNVASGDSITVDYYGVKIPSASSEAVTTTVGAYTSTSNTVNLASGPSSVPVQVILSNQNPGVDSTYTISGLAVPSGGIPALETTSSDQIELLPTGGTSGSNTTVLPTDPADYTLTDLTNGASSGVTMVTPASSGGVYIENTNALAAGDQLQITVNDVLNPSTASNTYTIQAENLVAATQTVTTTVPTAAMTYPNGALIQSGGQIDVVAGGYAFGIPTPAVLNKI